MSRLSAEDRKALIVETIDRMSARARTQADLTAARVAAACGISTTMLYRLASAEFRAARARLPGGREGDGLVRELRRAVREQREEIESLRRMAAAHEMCPTMDDVTAVVVLNEQLEIENRTLRHEVEAYRNRLAGRGTGTRPPRLVALPTDRDE
jgi:hypothetical protein